MNSLLHIRYDLLDNVALNNAIRSIKLFGKTVRPLYFVPMGFDEHKLKTALYALIELNLKVVISVGFIETQEIANWGIANSEYKYAIDSSAEHIIIKSVLGDFKMPSLVDNSFRDQFKRHIEKLKNSISGFSDVIFKIIPEMPYPYIPVYPHNLIDYRANNLFSEFLHKRYKSEDIISQIYGKTAKGEFAIPRGNIPPGRKRITMLNDSKDFCSYYFSDFFKNTLSCLPAELLSEPLAIPSIPLGYSVEDMEKGLSTDTKIQPGFLGLKQKIKYTLLSPSKNVVSGLFMENGKIPQDCKTAFYNMHSRIISQPQITCFIPPEYFNSNDKNISMNGIFPKNVPHGYLDINSMYRIWNEIIYPFKGILGVSSSQDVFKNDLVIVFSAEWMNKIWENKIINHADNGGTIVLAPNIPMYNIDGAVSGIIKEEFLKNKEIQFGDDQFFKMINIGKGKILIFPHKLTVSPKGTQAIRSLFRRICEC